MPTQCRERIELEANQSLDTGCKEATVGAFQLQENGPVIYSAKHVNLDLDPLWCHFLEG